MRIVLAACAFWIATPAFSAETAKPPVDRRVCRQSAETGTRIKSKECHLASEWVEIDAARAKQLEELQRQLKAGAAGERPPSNSPFPR